MKCFALHIGSWGQKLGFFEWLLQSLGQQAPLEASLKALPLHKELVIMLVMTNDQVKADPLFYSLQVSTCFLDTTGSLVEQMYMSWVEGKKSYEAHPGSIGEARQPSSDGIFLRSSPRRQTMIELHARDQVKYL